MRWNFRNYDLSGIINAKRMPITTPFSWYTVVSTWFYIGKIPIMPGTLGSIGAYPIYVYLYNSANSINELSKLFFLVAFLLFMLGWMAVAKFQKITNSFDHQCVVIDEVVGQLLTFAIAYQWLDKLSGRFITLAPDLSEKVWIFILGLAVFRFFDITKPLFIRYVDRYYKNAFGVMLDDILAAVFGSCVIYIIYLINELL